MSRSQIQDSDAEEELDVKIDDRDCDNGCDSI